MMGHEFAQPVPSKADPHEALEYIKVGVAIALDDDGAVIQARDVPANHHSIFEMAMGSKREGFRFFPQGKYARFDLCPRVWMSRKPADPGIRAQVAGLRQFSGAHVDKAAHSAGMH